MLNAIESNILYVYNVHVPFVPYNIDTQTQMYRYIKYMYMDMEALNITRIMFDANIYVCIRDLSTGMEENDFYRMRILYSLDAVSLTLSLLHMVHFTIYMLLNVA